MKSQATLEVMVQDIITGTSYSFQDVEDGVVPTRKSLESKEYIFGTKYLHMRFLAIFSMRI